MLCLETVREMFFVMKQSGGLFHRKKLEVCGSKPITVPLTNTKKEHPKWVLFFGARDGT